MYLLFSVPIHLVTIWVHLPERVLEKSFSVVERIKPTLPTYSTRAMRKGVFSKFGLLTSNTLKPAVLRCVYQELTGDASAATNTHEDEITEQVTLILDMEPYGIYVN